MDIRISMPLEVRKGTWIVRMELPLNLKPHLPALKDLNKRGCVSVKAYQHTCLLEFNGFTPHEAAARSDEFLRVSLPFIRAMSMLLEDYLSVPSDGWQLLQEGFWTTSIEAPDALRSRRLRA